MDKRVKMNKKLLISITVVSMMAIGVRATYFLRIPSVYAEDLVVRKISEIESATLIIRAVLLVEDFKRRIGNEDIPATVRGVIIFRDKGKKACVVDHEGVAKLSCPAFTKLLKIKPEDFTDRHWGLSVELGYPIEFKVDRGSGPNNKDIFQRPYYTAKFEWEHLEAKCKCRPRTKEEEERAGPIRTVD